jgi:hypothetical protein
MLRNEIGAKPRLLATEICDAIARSMPDRTQIRKLGQSLLRRHASLGLRPVVSSEEIVDAYYRCVLTGYLAKRYILENAALPKGINSSHKAIRRVCIAPEHSHARVADDDWRESWCLMQERNPEVNVSNAGSSARRADLYVVANGQVVSVEFKYVGSTGLRDARAPHNWADMPPNTRRHSCCCIPAHTTPCRSRRSISCSESRARQTRELFTCPGLRSQLREVPPNIGLQPTAAGGILSRRG